MVHSASRVLLLAALVGTAACGDKSPSGTSGPPRGSAVLVLSGHNRTDTVDAVQDSMLRVRVLRLGGIPAANTAVHVRAPLVETAPFGGEVNVVGSGISGVSPESSGLTDAQGTVAFRVRMGGRSGSGRLVVTVPELGLTDTARYTILPGAATRVRSLPEDTVVLPGARAPLRVAVSDRYGNARSDAIAITVVSGPGTLSGSEVVTGSSIGRITAVASVGGVRDTTVVRVVPAGTVAAATPSGTGHTAALYTFSLDGSGIRRVQVSAAVGYNTQMSVAWLSPTRLVYHDAHPDHTRGLYVVDLGTGTSGRLLAPAVRMATEDFPRVSRDGTWVYFGGGTTSRQAVYRARADGSATERISPGSDPFSEWGADPSPDGTRIAYVKEGHNSGDERLFVMELATRAVTPLNLMGVSPRWSPDGTRIAYAAQSRGQATLPAIANADGTGARMLSTTTPIRGDLSWSPDGKYIVAATNYVNQLLIIDVATGAEVAVNYPGIPEGVLAPVWKP